MASPRPRNATLHLYRHLLREASYLPPAARPFVWSRICTLFRRHRHDNVPSTPTIYRPLLPSSSPSSATAAARIDRAYRALRTLRAANNGDINRMRRVLLQAFGRIGPRRRELVNNLVRGNPPSSSEVLREQLQDLTLTYPAPHTTARTGENSAAAVGTEEKSRASNPTSTSHAGAIPSTNDKAPRGDWLDKWDTARIRAFVRTQMVAQGRLNSLPRPAIRGDMSVKPDLPKENAWGLPLHPKVARTKTKKWWRKLIHRVLPPVEKSQWELMSRLAAGDMGEHGEWDVPARRTPARLMLSSRVDGTAMAAGHAQAEDAGWNWQAYTSSPVRAVERKYSRRSRAFLTPGERDQVDSASSLPRPLGTPAVPIGLRHLTPRLWRRLYMQIWQMTATMERKQPGEKPAGPDNDRQEKGTRRGGTGGEGKDGGEWNITWGRAAFQAQRATRRHAELFDGADAQGRTSKIPGRSPA